MKFSHLRHLEVDIDNFLNKYIPHPRWHLFPRPLAHFLGHRVEPTTKVGSVMVMFWSFIGVFCGLLIVAATSLHTPSFRERDAPLVVGSFVSHHPLSIIHNYQQGPTVGLETVGRILC